MTTKTTYAMFAVMAGLVMTIGLVPAALAVVEEDDIDVNDVPNNSSKQKGERSTNVCAGGTEDTITNWAKVSNDDPDDYIEVKYDDRDCTSVQNVSIVVLKNGSWAGSWSGSDDHKTVSFSSITVGPTDDFHFDVTHTVT